MKQDRYAWKVGEALDQFLNVLLLNGRMGETISMHTALSQTTGRRWACILCVWLSHVVETNHCARTLAGDAVSLRAGLLAMLSLLIVVAWLTGGFWWLVFRR